MGFLTPVLLGGIALIALPIALHLVMRRQPQKLEFPALQFVRKRRAANRRRFNLRHLLLLALRCALIAGLAVALARPTIKGSGLRGKEGAPLAVALVIDNSVRMQYVFQNQTRQQKAKEMAQWLVDQLPEDAQVAVVDRSRAATGFVVDLGTAESRVRNLAVENNPRPLENAVHEAIRLVAEQEDHRQEVFLFSDLSVESLDEAALEAIQMAMAEAPDVRLYLVDVGVEEVSNRALQPLELSGSVLRPGQPLRVEVPAEITGLAEAPLVEIYLQGADGKPIKRGQQILEVSAEGSGRAVFELGDLPIGTHQGLVKFSATDALEADNARYFTVEVRPTAKVLLLGERKSDALFLREALSPSLIANRADVRFQCVTETVAKAASIDLEGYDAVCLLDPPPLSEGLWQSLTEYVEHGGGVGVFLGHRARLSNFNGEAAQRLLPGRLLRKSRHATYLRPQQLDHPVLTGLRNYAEQIPWQLYPVLQYWEFGDWTGDAYVVARFADNKAALIERPVGRGRVVTFATAVSDRLEIENREPWNLLPTGPEPWPFVALSNQLVGYLAQSESEPLDFYAGETVSLRLAPRHQISSFVLHQPNGESLRRSLPPGEDTIQISTTQQLGNYRVASGGESRLLDRGFSVNVSPAMSQLTRVAPEVLAEALQSEQVKLASSLDDVERYVDIGRTGQGLFSWAIMLVAIVWGAEHLLGNRFYREAS
ncbi:MAG: hypothetical protein GXP26_11685 [Planctomycetes bacterium]|nr:hypothetical protein [Planctomycetota bacterium]